MDFFELFTIPFMIRALVGSILLSLLFGLFGTFIVPRRVSFMADGISHASLLGIAFGLFIGTYPLIYAFLAAAIGTPLVVLLYRKILFPYFARLRK